MSNEIIEELIKEKIFAACVMDDIETVNDLLAAHSAAQDQQAQQILCDVSDYRDSVLCQAVALGSSKIVARFFELATEVPEKFKMDAAKTAMIFDQLPCLEIIYRHLAHRRTDLLEYAAKRRSFNETDFLLNVAPEPVCLRVKASKHFISYVEYLCVDFAKLGKEVQSADAHADHYLRYAKMITQLLQLRTENGSLLLATPKLAEKIAPFLGDDLINTVMYDLLIDSEIDATRSFSVFLQNLCNLYDQSIRDDLPFEFVGLQETLLEFIERMVEILELTLKLREENIASHIAITQPEVLATKNRVTQQLGLSVWRGVVGRAWEMYQGVVPETAAVATSRYTIR